MLHGLSASDSDTTHFKKVIFEALIGFCCSNSAHARCLAQYFVREMFDDPIFRAFIPQGHELLLNFFNTAKDCKQMLKKYEARVMEYTKMIEGNGLDVVLSTEIDEYGEFMHEPFSESMRIMTSEAMSIFRDQDHFLGDRDEYWLKLYKAREAAGNLNLQMQHLAES